MTQFSKYYLLAFILSAMVSCSSDSEDPTPEPDVTAPTANFNIAGTSSGSSTEPVVVSNQIQININAQDSGGIAKVEAYIDDQKVGEDTTAPYQITIDISGYASKNSLTGKFTDYVLKVTVTDTSGNTTSKEQVINIDNELPTVSEVSLLEGTILNGDTNIVTFNIMDNEGLNEVKTYLNNELLSEITDANYEININTLNLSDGENTLKIEASDLAENLAVHEVVFISDNTGPEIILESLTENPIMDETILLSPEITDEFSSIVSVEFLVGEESQLLIEEGSTFQWEFNPDDFVTGATSILIKAKDAFENETIVEFPIEILRRLITINIPENFYDPQKARIYVFASGMDGKLLDSQRIFQETTKIILRTGEDLTEDTEIMLTFADYYSGVAGNVSEFTTIQNLIPGFSTVFNLKTKPRYEGIDTSPKRFPTQNFNPSDDISISAEGFGYGSSYFKDSNELSISRRRNTTTESNTDLLYIPLLNRTLDEYSYYVASWDELTDDFVVSPSIFTDNGVETRTFLPLSGSFENFSMWVAGYFSENDFQNDVYHRIDSHGYQGGGFYFPNGVPYYYNSIFSNYRYVITVDNYRTERIGEPVSEFQPLDWTIDYSVNGYNINITKAGLGHTVGRLVLNNANTQIIEGKNVSYSWNIAFDSQAQNQIIIPEVPEEIQSWGFYQIHQQSGFEIVLVEIQRYDGIDSYQDYVNKILVNNKRSYLISPKKELVYKSIVPVYPFYRTTNFILD